MTTLAIPYGERDFQVDLDFVEHRLRVSDSEANLFTMPLEAMSVARFYRDFMAGLNGLGIEAHTYEAGANLGGWDRAALEPAMLPGRPPNRPWSTATDSAPGPASRQLALNRSKGWRRSRQ